MEGKLIQNSDRDVYVTDDKSVTSDNADAENEKHNSDEIQATTLTSIFKVQIIQISLHTPQIQQEEYKVFPPDFHDTVQQMRINPSVRHFTLRDETEIFLNYL